jgi:PTH1 family peptidyl-tRNA hydrolase
LKLIIGLGNPGLRYSGTRHNVGFSVVKSLSGRLGLKLKKEKGISALSAKSKEGFVVALPLTYMNLSGGAVKALKEKYAVALNDILVVCDDLDLDPGRLKMSAGGSSAGHNGIQSVIEALKGEDFVRLRIGIGRPPEGVDGAEFVLKGFRFSERQKVKPALEKARDCCILFLEKDVDTCMNQFNRKEG